MMVGQRIRRTREYPGPIPPCVAVRARVGSKCAPENLFLENRKKEEQLRDTEKENYHKKLLDLKNEWDHFTGRKVLFGNIRREVDQHLKNHEFDLEERRERLRELLKKEEKEHIAAMEAAEETTLERQAKMRERAKFLKEKREQERLEIVQEKYDQQFRNQCEELRSTLSKREQDLVCAERLLQLKMKGEEAKQQKAYDDMYADLWEKDRQEKMAREERDAQAAHERNRKMLDVITQQKAALEARKEEARKLKEDELQLMKEQAALRKLEEEAAAEEKRRRQQETRDMLDQTLRMKMRKKAKEEQEQLAFDLKMLEQLLEETQNEAREQLLRKIALRDEDRRYREYLAKLLEEEKQKERELERIMQQELDSAWQKRLDQWREERLKRRKLLEDIMASRDQQIQQRLAENERLKAENERERMELQRTIEENRKYEAEQAAKRMADHLKYQNDLKDQINYNDKLREDRRLNDEYEYLMGIQAEREYQDKLKSILNDAAFQRPHPMRRALQNQ